MQRYCFFLIYANNFEKKCVFWENSGVFVVLGEIDGIDVIVAIDVIDAIVAIDAIDVIVAIVAIVAIDAIGILAGGDACAHRTRLRTPDNSPSPLPPPRKRGGGVSLYTQNFLCYFLRFDYLFSSCCFRLFFESFSSRFRD